MRILKTGITIFSALCASVLCAQNEQQNNSSASDAASAAQASATPQEQASSQNASAPSEPAPQPAAQDAQNAGVPSNPPQGVGGRPPRFPRPDGVSPFERRFAPPSPASSATPSNPSDPANNSNLKRVDAHGEMQGPFYFVDESPSQILQVLEALSKTTILQAQGLPNVKINFVSKKKMMREDAIAAFKSLLSLNGVAVLPLDDGTMRAVPVIGVTRQSPEFLVGDISKMKPSQVFYTRLFELDYVEASAIQPKLKPFLSVDGTAVVEAFPRSNAILITDTLVNLQRVDTFLKKLDAPASLREDIAFISIKNVSASDLREKLVAMQNDLLKKYFENTTLDVDMRTNQLIVVTQKGNLDAIKKFINGLDVEAEPILKNEVFYIRHCKAEEIETVLNNIVTKQQQQVAKATQSKQNAANAATRNAIQAAQAARARQGNNNRGGANQNVQVPKVNLTSGDGSTGLEFSEYVQVVAHKPSSSIVAYGTPADLKQLKSIIEKLDIAIEQVKIDVIITEVTLSDSQVSGLSTFGLSYNLEEDSGFGMADKFSATTSTFSMTDSSSPAFSLGMNEKSFSMVFNVASQNQNVKVLSSPTIVTTHAQEAEVNVSEKYPIITGTTSDISNISTTRTEVTQEDIGIKLVVTPYVGTDNMIQLEVKQNVDSIARYVEIDGNNQPVVSTRYAKSYVSAKNGEVIVLAGLQHAESTNIDGGVWLLSDIPLIGEFFKPKSDSISRRELIIFIRPTIIKSVGAENAIAMANIKNSSVESELSSYLKDGRFYSNEEIRANFEEFEKNRPYNRLFRAPQTLITGEKRLVEGSSDYKKAQKIDASEEKSESKAELPKDGEKTENPKEEKAESNPEK